MIESILVGFGQVANVLTFEALLAVAAGVMIGNIGGALPGLTVSVTMVLVLPLSFFLAPATAWGLFLGVYTGGMTGGGFPAVLLNIPGTPSAAATAIEGYPLTQQGRAGEGIGVVLLASTVGGFVSWLALVLVAPGLAKVAIHFQAVELAAMIFMALMVISSFGGSDPLKGIVAGVVGVAMGTVGLDPILGTERFTFGIVDMQGGISFLAAMVGLFAIPQLLEEITKTDKRPLISTAVRVRDIIKPLFSFGSYATKTFLASLVGVLVGIIPGSSGPIAVFVAYRYLRNTKKTPSPSYEGVAIPEAANNGVTGGALIPLLTLGIPGDTVTAILLGAFLIQDIFPGPVLFKLHADIVYAIFVLFLVGVIMNYVLGVWSARAILYCLRIPRYALWTAVAVMCVVGPFALRNTLFDVMVTFVFGILGYLMRLYGFSVIPLVLGLMLGPLFETNLRTALITSQGDWSVFATRPVSLLFIVLGFGLVASQLISYFWKGPAIDNRTSTSANPLG